MTINPFKKQLKDCYLEEIIFSSDRCQNKKSAVAFALKYLDKRLHGLFNNGFELGKHSIKEVNIPFDDCADEYCEFCNNYYHFLIVLDKKYKAKLNHEQAYIYKLLHNNKFIDDLAIHLNKAKLETSRLDELSSEYDNDFILDWTDLIELFKKYSIPFKYSYVIDCLINYNNGVEYILDNLEYFVISNCGYREYYNKLVYLHSYNENHSPEFNYCNILVEYDNLVDKKEVKDSFLMIDYLQSKYLKNTDNRVKFDFDICHKLKKIDVDNLNMTDCEKADILFNKGMDLGYDKLPSIDEDKRKIAKLRTIRARCKKYLKK